MMNMNCRFLIGVVLLSSVVCITFAAFSVDVATAVSQASWRCIKNAGCNFALVRVYRSIGRIDPNGAETIKNARAAGIRYVEGYIFPCRRCGRPKTQVGTTIRYLRSKGAIIRRLWLDVEKPEYWRYSKRSNVLFIQRMVDATEEMGVTVAIYTSASQWGPIAGTSRAFSNLKLWYTHDDNRRNFGNFRSFGGWTRPAMKQYALDTTMCGVGVDLNWYP